MRGPRARQGLLFLERAGSEYLEVVEHPVHDHPCDRHIESKRERPAGNSHVLLKLFAPSTVDCDQCQWNDTSGQDNVGDQECEVDRSREASPLE
jgi:hypothetical protein